MGLPVQEANRSIYQTAAGQLKKDSAHCQLRSETADPFRIAVAVVVIRVLMTCAR